MYHRHDIDVRGEFETDKNAKIYKSYVLGCGSGLIERFEKYCILITEELYNGHRKIVFRA